MDSKLFTNYLGRIIFEFNTCKIKINLHLIKCAAKNASFYCASCKYFLKELNRNYLS